MNCCLNDHFKLSVFPPLKNESFFIFNAQIIGLPPSFVNYHTWSNMRLLIYNIKVIMRIYDIVINCFYCFIVSLVCIVYYPLKLSVVTILFCNFQLTY